ncbi:MAG: type II toxin-antitoxin system HicB family antitoxin [Nanoarchaeota archaeon]
MTKQFTAIIEQDEDGIYVGRIPQLRGCVSQGDTIDELIMNLKDAVKLYLEVEGDKEIELSKYVGTQQIEIV